MGVLGEVVSEEIHNAVAIEKAKLKPKQAAISGKVTETVSKYDPLELHKLYWEDAKVIAWDKSKEIAAYDPFEVKSQIVKIDKGMSFLKNVFYLLRSRSNGDDFTAVLTTKHSFYHQWSFYAHLSESYYFLSTKEKVKQVQENTTKSSLI